MLRGDFQKSQKSVRHHAVAYKMHVYNKMIDIIDEKRMWMSDESIGNALCEIGYMSSCVIDTETGRVLWNSKNIKDCSDLDLASGLDRFLFNFPITFINIENAVNSISRDNDPVAKLIAKRRLDVNSRPKASKTNALSRVDGEHIPFNPSLISNLLKDINKRSEWEEVKLKFGTRTRTSR
jgi:hypothetical protein